MCHAVRQGIRLVALLLLATLDATGLDPDRALSQYQQSAWQVEDGLPQNAVRALAQAGDGTLLVGTSGGLTRFDGRHFLPAPQGSGLDAPDAADALLRASDGALWVGFDSGDLIRRRGDVSTLYRKSDGLAGGDILCIYEDRSRAVWVASRFGVTRIERGKPQIITGVSRVLPPMSAVFADTGESGVVIATLSGLLLYRQGRLQSLPFDAARYGRLTSVYCDRSGRLWIGTSECLLSYNPLTGAVDVQRGIPGPIRAILEDRQGNLWIGTVNRGLIRKHGLRIESWTTAQGLPDNNIRSLFEDNEGNLWIGTRGNGLVRLTDSVMTPYSIGENSEVFASSILEDSRGRLWLGTWGGGVFQLRTGKLASMHTPSDSVTSLAEDASGQLWIGAFNGVVLRYDGHRYRTFGPEDGLPRMSVKAIVIARDGALWLGSNGGGLLRFSCGVPSRQCAKLILPGASVIALREDSRGVIWAGTSNGLFAIQGSEVTRYRREQGLGDDSIASLSLDSAGVLWVGTKAGGLDRVLDDIKLGRRLVHLRGGEGLPASPITSVLDDRQGFLWLATTHGVVCVRRAELEDLVYGRVAKVESETYSRADGMPSSECRGVAQPPSWRQHNGLLWFATAKGFVSADPSRVRPAWLPPQGAIDQVFVDQTPVNWQRGILLQPGARQLEIRMSAVRLATPQHVQFRYRLAGYDPDWVSGDTAQSARYARLPAGNYRFEFAVRDGIGKWSSAGAEIPIRQLPVFYRTWWFYGLVAAAMMATAWAFTRWRFLRLRGRLAAVAEERNRIAREWHDTLMAGFAAISWQLEATQTELKTSSPEHAASTLDIARSMVRHCQSEARRIIWDLRSRAEEDEPLADVLSKAALNLTSGTEVVSQVITEGQQRQLPGLVAHNLLRIGQEAITNAIRHSSANRITLRLRYEAAKIRLSVKDDGCGFNSAGPGKDGHFGIPGMDERARKLGGTVTILTAPGRGTEVIADLPVNGSGKGRK